MHIDTKI
jgi:hypothetical protein